MVWPSSRHALTSKKSTSSLLERTRFTAIPKEHTGTPALVKRNSGSRVRLPPRTTRLKLTMRVSPSCVTIWRSCAHGLCNRVYGGEVFPTGSFPWRALKQIFLLGCLRRSYSPECVEEEFSEVLPHSPALCGRTSYVEYPRGVPSIHKKPIIPSGCIMAPPTLFTRVRGRRILRTSP